VSEAFDPGSIIEALAEHRVRYVLIGALAARLYGFPRVTADADMTPQTTDANLDRLAKALRSLDARIYTESIPEGLVFDCSAAMLRRASTWNLVTSAGRMHIAFQPSGTGGFDDLHANASRFEVYGRRIEVAALEDILRSKEAADRPKDRQDALLIREMLKAR